MLWKYRKSKIVKKNRDAHIFQMLIGSWCEAQRKQMIKGKWTFPHTVFLQDFCYAHLSPHTNTHCFPGEPPVLKMGPGAVRHRELWFFSRNTRQCFVKLYSLASSWSLLKKKKRMQLGGKDAFFYKINSCVIHPTQGGKCLVFHCFWVLTLKQSLENLLCMFLLPAATVCSDCMTTPSMFVEVLMFVIYFQCVHDSTTCHKGRGSI